MRPVPTSQRWLVPVLIVVFALTVSGGLLAREAYRTAAGAGGRAGTVPDGGSPSSRGRTGSSRVALTPGAAAHPHGDEIRALLQDYFDAINRKNYALWTTTVTARRARNKSRQEWLLGYRSTTDSDILVYRIEALTGNRLRVLLAFTSTQDPVDAPTALPVRCIRWRLALPAVRIGGEWKLAKLPGTVQEYTRCSR